MVFYKWQLNISKRMFLKLLLLEAILPHNIMETQKGLIGYWSGDKEALEGKVVGDGTNL
jgi:hypothetical protein